MNDNLYSIEDDINDDYSDRRRSENDAETDTLYSLEESDEATMNESAAAPSDASVLKEMENEAESWNGETGNGKSFSIALLLKILATPVEGWKALKRGRFKPEAVASACFYPLVAMASLSEFTALFYDVNLTPTSLLVPAIVTFITFFFGYFTVLLCGNILLPSKESQMLQKPFGKEFVMLSISTLALFYIIYRVFPLLGPVLVFLPLWTIYIVFKGVKLFRVDKELEIRVGGTLSFLIIGAPLLWNWLLSEFMPGT